MQNYRILLWSLVVISGLIMVVTLLDLFPENPLKNSKFIVGMQFIVIFNLVKKFQEKKQQ